MDWLKKLPGIGPLVERAMRTHAWSAYERLDSVHWTRLAAAMTFISFLALFPLITVAAAIAAATLSKSRQQKLEDKLTEQVPGISDQLNLNALVDNAGTIGLVAGAVLLFTGIGWVGSIRECLRAVWELEDEDENPVLRKLKDAGVLIGLGGAGLASVAASTLASTAVGWSADLVGVSRDGWGGVLLQWAAFAIAVLADFLLLLYVLTLLPGVQPPRRLLITAGLMGAAGFELLKLLLGGYMKGVAARSMYGAFGVPVALLLWINFTAKLLLFCAAWTATRKQGRTEEEPEEEPAEGDRGAPNDEAPSGGVSDGPSGAPGPAAAAGG
ncbi:YihY/virulence factor BrkB family protein [Streptomyces sp. NBC_01381]|uniref:YihY/virulence factor BrkB family protein n=1 Tax=Streptomyces sp. NBC_01381 TaxID=2903845 RepID=UPI002253835D|nr:YihY/virulence factor BrkB family protein [Streptomyces sp. NBC_01381]MCX4669410.1 YihY/virulence factor BrkB family protein [Streptomyces sp. NBC_01381]